MRKSNAVAANSSFDGVMNDMGLPVKSVTMSTSVVQGKLDHDSSRFNDSAKQTHQGLTNQLSANLNGLYAQALRTVLLRRMMPQ